MLEWIISSSVLIAVVIAIRAVGVGTSSFTAARIHRK